jgi:zinc protease
MVIEGRTQRGELVGGIQYALLPKKTRGETVTMMMTLRFGTGETLKDKIGAVELLGLLMKKGTDKFDYTEFQDELTRLRAEVSMFSTIGLLQLTVKTKREFLPEVIALLGDVLRRPRLDAGELEVIRRQVVTGLEKGTTDPQTLAPRSVRKSLSPYGPDDIRYVMSIDEEIEMYKKVKVEEIRSLHARFLSNQAGEVSIVGDFDPEQVIAMLRAQLADWETSQSYVRVDQDPHPEIDGSLNSIETPDKANAVFYCGQQYALSDDDPDYASLVLGNFILGGGSLSSRLGDRVRQKEGLSYGIGSGLSARPKDDRVDFTLYAIVNPGNADRLREVIREEIDLIRDQGVTDKELKEAKVSYLQSARVRRTGDSALTGELLMTMFTGRTMQHHADHEQQIEAATVESVNRAIRKYIDPDKWVKAIAGDFAAAKKP